MTARPGTARGPPHERPEQSTRTDGQERRIPIREQRKQARMRRTRGFGAIGVVVLLLVAWVTVWGTSSLAIEPRLARFVIVALSLVIVTAGGAQVLDWFRRPYWDR